MTKKQSLPQQRKNSPKKIIKRDVKNFSTSFLRHLTEGVDSLNYYKEKELIALLENGDPTSGETKRTNELIEEIFNINGIRNGKYVGDLDYNKFSKIMMKTRSDLIEEYDCKKSLEFMLVDRIIANYWRAMKCDRIYNRCLAKEDGSFSADQLKINFMKELSKSIERAERQLNADIILLKELKQPKLNVKISTKNAYVANNQQVINNNEDNSQNTNH